MKRVFLIVLDSAGIGRAKDAVKFGDSGANTVLHTIESSPYNFNHLKMFGLYNLVGLSNNLTIAYYTNANEISNGKDTLTGHLEMMGIITTSPFKTFTENGFPKELIAELEKRTGRKIIGNCNASGTEIIEMLGEEHIKTGSLIVYTSADSVLQIAAHESVIPINELLRFCEIARELTLNEEWKVGRIIARPFTGKPGSFTRTGNRHDYALNPASTTVLDNLKDNNYDVISIGKISDIFNGRGITESIRITDNLEGISEIINIIKNKDFNGLCFANLNDFDSKYGHRRNVYGYAKSLKEFNDSLPLIIKNLREDDLIIITADHGNDPTFKGTDHTRENVPVLIYGKSLKGAGELESFDTFANIGATIADIFKVDIPYGTSYLKHLK